MRFKLHVSFWLVCTTVAVTAGCRHFESVQADLHPPDPKQYPSPEEAMALEIALTQAAADCEIERVRELLEQGADPDGLLSTKARRYQYAHGDRERALQLPGVFPSPLLACMKPTSYEDRPEDLDALWAIQRDQAAVAQVLLSAGADPNLQAHDWFGLFPLLFAAEDNNSFAIRILLDAGAFTHLSNENHGQFDPTSSPSSALGWAVHNEDSTIIELLLDAGAYPTIGGHRYTPLVRAAMSGNPRILKMVMEPLGDEGDYRYYQNEFSTAMTALIRAWPNKGSELVDAYDLDQFKLTFEILDQAGATIEYDAIEDDSLFYYISRADDHMIDTWLVHKIVEHPATCTLTVLYLREMLDDDETSDLLAAISQGLDPDAADPAGRSALHYAGIENHLEAYVALVRAGADTHIQDRQGKTPIEYAEFFTIEEVEALLNEG